MTANALTSKFTIPYNLLLITIGSLIFGIGIKAIALPHGLITGGLAGVCLLIYYWTGLLSPGQLYFLLNIPIFLLGWRYVSRRFFFYSLYGMTALTLTMDWMKFQIPVHEPMLAVLAGGLHIVIMQALVVLSFAAFADR